MSEGKQFTDIKFVYYELPENIETHDKIRIWIDMPVGYLIRSVQMLDTGSAGTIDPLNQYPGLVVTLEK